jgi:hypothetical protein
VLRRRLDCSAVYRKPEGLPAVPAIATVSAISATSATTTVASAPAATTASSSAVTTAPSATATTAFSLRPRFIHDEVPPTEVLSVQRIDCLIRIFVVCYFHKGEAARLTRKTVTDQIDTRGSHTDL